MKMVEIGKIERRMLNLKVTLLNYRENVRFSTNAACFYCKTPKRVECLHCISRYKL